MGEWLQAVEVSRLQKTLQKSILSDALLHSLPERIPSKLPSLQVLPLEKHQNSYPFPTFTAFAEAGGLGNIQIE